MSDYIAKRDRVFQAHLRVLRASNAPLYVVAMFCEVFWEAVRADFEALKERN